MNVFEFEFEENTSGKYKATNQAELDAELQKKLDSYETDPKLRDPEDYIHNPEAYIRGL